MILNLVSTNNETFFSPKKKREERKKQERDAYNNFQCSWSILRVVSLESHDIRPRDFNLILKTTIKYFPHELMLCKVTFCHQISFVSRLILEKKKSQQAKLTKTHYHISHHINVRDSFCKL